MIKGDYMKKCCCLTTIIVFVLIIALLCVGLFVLTPNMIGLGDTVVMDGKTIKDLGLGDVTIFEVLKTLSVLTKQSTPSEVLGEGAYSSNDLNSASNNLGIQKDGDGNVDYVDIINNGSINQTNATVTLTDKEFAALADDIVECLGENPTQDMDEQLTNLLKNVDIYQLSPEIVGNDGDVQLTTTVGISIKEILGDTLPSNDNAITQVVNSLPDTIIVTMTLPLNNTSDGYSFDDNIDPQNVKINGQELPLVNEVINNLQLADGQTINDMLHGTLGDQISNFLNDWGVTLGNGVVTIAPSI